MWPANWRVSGRSLTVPASPERYGARFGGVRMGSAARFGPAGGREVGTRLSARVGLDEGFYLH